VSHIDSLIPNDPDGMKLLAYTTCVPLYILADFLGLPALCHALTDRMHRTNRRLAAHLQRLAIFDPQGRVFLPTAFIASLADCAQQAYGIPVQRTPDDIEGCLPGGIRTPFVELFELARYRPLDNALPRLATAAPLLLIDIMLAQRDLDGFGHPSRRPRACKDCGVDPITGMKPITTLPPAPAPAPVQSAQGIVGPWATLPAALPPAQNTTVATAQAPNPFGQPSANPATTPQTVNPFGFGQPRAQNAAARPSPFGQPQNLVSAPQPQNAPAVEVEVKDQGARTNFWATHNLCFECSVYYPRKGLLSGVSRAVKGKEEGKEGGRE